MDEYNMNENNTAESREGYNADNRSEAQSENISGTENGYSGYNYGTGMNMNDYGQAGNSGNYGTNSGNYGTNSGNYGTNDGNNAGSGNDKPKKKHLFAKIMVPVLLVAALGTGVFFTVRHFTADKNTKKEEIAEDSGKSFDDEDKPGLPGEELPDEAKDGDPEEFERQKEQLSEQDEAAKAAADSLNNEDSGIEAANVTGTVTALDVSGVVEDVMPCVVAITDNLEYTTSGYYNPYNYLFGGDSYSGGSTQETTASGSGVIIGTNDTELLIVTNDHVVDNEGNYSSYTISSKGLSVQFSDGTSADATIRGTDEEVDLAVIAVKLSDISEDTKNTIKVAVIGDSDEIKVGSGVIAIGNALGYGQSVTTGIISAKDREVTIDGVTRKLLQTDAAINPGNSGGGLFNAAGELIGINSAKSVDTDVEGMGFAIPITSAMDIIEELKTAVQISDEDKGYLGINGETVPSTYTENYGYPEGVSVTRIGENSPAEEAGLQIYDIITEVNGKAVTTMSELQKAVQKHAAGETITITVMRPEGRSFREMELKVTLASYEEINGIAAEEEEEPYGNEEDAPEGGENAPEKPDGQPGEKPGDTPEEGEDDEEDSDDYDSIFDWFFNNF